MANNPREIYFRLAACASVSFIIVAAVSIFLIGPDLMFLTAAAIGCALLAVKSVFWWNLPAALAGGENKRPAKALIINIGFQLMTGAALLIAVFVSARFLYGMAAGMLGAVASTVIGTVIFGKRKPL